MFSHYSRVTVTLCCVYCEESTGIKLGGFNEVGGGGGGYLTSLVGWGRIEEGK